LSNPPFYFFDTRALWRCPNVKKIKKGELRPVWRSTLW